VVVTVVDVKVVAVAVDDVRVVVVEEVALVREVVVLEVNVVVLDDVTVVAVVVDDVRVVVVEEVALVREVVVLEVNEVVLDEVTVVVVVVVDVIQPANETNPTYLCLSFSYTHCLELHAHFTLTLPLHVLCHVLHAPTMTSLHQMQVCILGQPIGLWC
jgi:hypothetical protein